MKHIIGKKENEIFNFVKVYLGKSSKFYLKKTLCRYIVNSNKISCGKNQYI